MRLITCCRKNFSLSRSFCHFFVSLSASFLVETKNTLPLGVVTTLDTTGLVVLRSSATLEGVTGLNGLSVGSSTFFFFVQGSKIST